MVLVLGECTAQAGLAFSCKFTAIVFPPILGGRLVACARGKRERTVRCRMTWTVSSRMAAFVVLMLLTNLAITGFARISAQYEPGTAPQSREMARARRRLTQLAGSTKRRCRKTGSASPRRCTTRPLAARATSGANDGSKGWWYYYFVALAVKVPIGFWLLVVARLALDVSRRKEGSIGSPTGPGPRAAKPGRTARATRAGVCRHAPAGRIERQAAPAGVPPLLDDHGHRIVAQLRHSLSAAAGATGHRVGVGPGRGPTSRSGHDVAALLGLGGFRRRRSPAAIRMSSPISMVWRAGREGGRHILADSNLDWGQGLESLARLQREQPEFRDMTFYYFGDTEPGALRRRRTLPRDQRGRRPVALTASRAG